MHKLDEKALAAAARAEALVDGRDFDALGRTDKARYTDRAADGIHAYLASLPSPESAAQQPATEAVRVKPLDLSGILRDAFLSGRGVTGRLSEEDQAAWMAYDPEPLLAYQRIVAALSQSPSKPAGGSTDENH